jgi:hypothetical protein
VATFLRKRHQAYSTPNSQITINTNGQYENYIGAGKCLTNSTDITEQTKLGLEYQFSAKDFKPHEQSPMVLYGLASTMCWIESNYKWEYAMFYVALNMM